MSEQRSPLSRLAGVLIALLALPVVSVGLTYLVSEATTSWFERDSAPVTVKEIGDLPIEVVDAEGRVFAGIDVETPERIMFVLEEADPVLRDADIIKVTIEGSEFADQVTPSLPWEDCHITIELVDDARYDLVRSGFVRVKETQNGARTLCGYIYVGEETPMPN